MDIFCGCKGKNLNTNYKMQNTKYGKADSESAAKRRFKVESLRLKEEQIYGKADSDPPPRGQCE